MLPETGNSKIKPGCSFGSYEKAGITYRFPELQFLTRFRNRKGGSEIYFLK